MAAPLAITAGFHGGTKYTPAAAASEAAAAAPRQTGAGHEVAKSITASRRLVTIPILIDAWTPKAGSTRNPASTVPAIAPSVFTA